MSCLAIIRFAASLGWYGSQNTYLERSSQREDVGPHGMIPANWPPLPQQALLADLNPAMHNGKRKIDHDYFLLIKRLK